jgi:hypothetical protein
MTTDISFRTVYVVSATRSGQAILADHPNIQRKVAFLQGCTTDAHWADTSSLSVSQWFVDKNLMMNRRTQTSNNEYR